MKSININIISKYVLSLFFVAALSFCAQSFSMELVRSFFGLCATPVHKKKDVLIEAKDVYNKIDHELFELCCFHYNDEFPRDKIIQLIALGANINSEKISIMYHAIDYNFPLEHIKFLLLHGAIPGQACFEERIEECFADGFPAGTIIRTLKPEIKEYFDLVKDYCDNGVLLPDKNDEKLCEFARALSLRKFIKKRTIFSNLAPDNRSMKKTDCRIHTLG